LFFSAGKTVQEVKRREGLFFDDLVEQVDAHIVWHVRDILRRAYAEVLFGSEDAEAIQLREEIDALATDFTADWLSSQIHSGAGTTGEYTIVYCNQVASAIKQNVRREAFELIDRLGEMVAHQSGTELEEVNSELQVLSGPLEKQNRLDEFIQMEKTYVTDL